MRSYLLPTVFLCWLFWRQTPALNIFVMNILLLSKKFEHQQFSTQTPTLLFRYIFSEIFHCFFFSFSVYKFHISLLLVTHTDLCAFEHIVSLLKMPLWNKKYIFIWIGIIHNLKKISIKIFGWKKNVLRNYRNRLWSTYFPSSSFSS